MPTHNYRGQIYIMRTTSLFEAEALVVFLVAVFSLTGGSDGAWCICRPNMSDSVLQKTLDYACGAGADCGPINQNGVCYSPNTVKAHCSYAVNSYYQRKGQSPQACDFAGTAALTQQDPSANGCSYSASPSASGTGTGTGTGAGNNNGGGAAGTGTGTGTNTGAGGVSSGTGAGMGTGVTPTPNSTTNPGLATPSIMTPTNSGTGGVLGGLGPSGNSISTDNNTGRIIFGPSLASFLIMLILSFLAC